MRDLIAESLSKESKVAEAKRLILEVLSEYQSHLRGVSPPDPERRQGYDTLLKHFGELRGGALFYPYLGSGFGRGSLVELLDGSIKYDFISGIGAHPFGHLHPALVEASLDAALAGTVMQGNLQQEAAIVPLVETLLDTANRRGAELGHCFITTSGAMANENGLKVIFHNKRPANRLLAFKGCFMGRTLALAQVTDKPAYRAGLPQTLRVDYVPFFDFERRGESARQAVEVVRNHLSRHPGEYAGMVFELIQGEGGFYPGEKAFFLPLLKVLKEAGVAIMIDEIQTFGRTEEPFAFQLFGLDEYVDVVTIGKLSQVCATLYRKSLCPSPGVISQTFTASTSAIYAARAIIDGLLNGGFFGPGEKISRLHSHFEIRLMAIAMRHPGWISGPYGIGTMIAFTVFDGNFEGTKRFLHNLFEAGVIGFSTGQCPTRVRFLIPPGAVTCEEIDEVSAIIEKVLDKSSAAAA